MHKLALIGATVIGAVNCSAAPASLVRWNGVYSPADSSTFGPAAIAPHAAPTQTNSAIAPAVRRARHRYNDPRTALTSVGSTSLPELPHEL